MAKKWNLIFQGSATSNFDLLQKYISHLTIETSLMTLTHSTKNGSVQEASFQLNETHYHFRATNGIRQNDVALNTNSEIKEVFYCFMSNNERGLSTFEEHFEDTYSYDYRDFGLLCFNGEVLNYKIYKHDEEDSFLFVNEWQPSTFNFLVLGDFILNTENKDQRVQSIATNGRYYKSDQYISIQSDFFPIFGHDYSKLVIKYNQKFISNATHVEDGNWSNDWFKLTTNVLLNESSNGQPTFGMTAGSYNDQSIFRASKTHFDNKHIPLPIYIYTTHRQIHDSHSQTLFAFVPDLYSICFESINVEEVLTYGEREVICFPNYRKTIPADFDEIASSVSGLAIRIK